MHSFNTALSNDEYNQMTTFSHDLTLNDEECIMVESALNLLFQHSKEQVANGAGAPHLANMWESEWFLERHNLSIETVSKASMLELVLTDSERSVLENALKLMINDCEQKLGEGAAAPYQSDKDNAEAVFTRLTSSSGRMTSFFDPGSLDC